MLALSHPRTDPLASADIIVRSRRRAHSSVGRALPLQGNGRGFESLCAHRKVLLRSYFRNFAGDGSFRRVSASASIAVSFCYLASLRQLRPVRFNGRQRPSSTTPAAFDRLWLAEHAGRDGPVPFEAGGGGDVPGVDAPGAVGAPRGDLATGRKDSGEIAGIAPDVLTLFSKRSTQIDIRIR